MVSLSGWQMKSRASSVTYKYKYETVDEYSIANEWHERTLLLARVSNLKQRGW